MGTVLAVDIGGTKLAVGVVSGEGRLLASRQRPTSGAGAEGLFDAVADLLDEMRRDHVAAGGEAPTQVGVGCGGPMTPGGEAVSPLNIPQWRDFPLRHRLRLHTGLPVFVDNDAKALALGEGWCGAARGCHDYLAMVVSTGVGGGIVVDGRLLDGASSNAGHIGHVVVVPGGRPCGCGSRGCLEAEASGSGIAAVTGRPAAEAGAEVVERTGRLVGRAVAGMVVALDLRLACVGGSVALGFGEPFFAAANRELGELARIPYAVGARIVPAGLGADGPLIGAAAVALAAGAAR